ncbi:MAG: hypothetical protein GY793_10335 [Proteobacteria bacterium]|nr:hypothetical protein [Pseudomonadota bacterium]
MDKIIVDLCGLIISALVGAFLFGGSLLDDIEGNKEKKKSCIDSIGTSIKYDTRSIPVHFKGDK